MDNFLAAYHTDAGIRKKTNQDSILMQGVSFGQEEILLAVLCDGMGGMSKGELASATVIRGFSDWFREIYILKGNVWNEEEIKEQWHRILITVNDKLFQYGEREKIQLGTTATIVLLSSEGNYLIGHIGDTRAYRISEKMEQLTEDHTYVAREVKRGNMTPEQAIADPRRNVLLQCIGANNVFEMQYVKGWLKKGEALLICSDGFRHEVSDEEIWSRLRPSALYSESEIKEGLTELVELNKAREEKDNISSVYIKLQSYRG